MSKYLLENGTDAFLLEDGTGVLILESSVAAADSTPDLMHLMQMPVILAQ